MDEPEVYVNGEKRRLSSFHLTRSCGGSCEVTVNGEDLGYCVFRHGGLKEFVNGNGEAFRVWSPIWIDQDKLRAAIMLEHPD